MNDGLMPNAMAAGHYSSELDMILAMNVPNIELPHLHNHSDKQDASVIGRHSPADERRQAKLVQDIDLLPKPIFVFLCIHPVNAIPTCSAMVGCHGCPGLGKIQAMHEVKIESHHPDNDSSKHGTMVICQITIWLKDRVRPNLYQ